MNPILALAALAAVALMPAAAHGAEATGRGPAQDGKPAAGWTRTLNVDLSARDLALPPDASAQRLAKAALKRTAGRLRLRGSTLRLDRRLRTPAADGARALTQLRFQQTAGSLRVIWSQIDVTVVAGRVSAIGATVVPARTGRAAGERRISRKRARGIALHAVRGASEALDPLLAAYAGAPTTRRNAKRRAARRAWVVEVRPPPGPGEEVPTPLCIVVDAQSGKVIGRWPGMADRPDRGPQARGAKAAGEEPVASTAPSRPAARQVLLRVFDATNGSTDYAGFLVDGDPGTGRAWPPFTDLAPWNRECAPPSSPTNAPCVNYGAATSNLMDAVATNARNVAFTICAVRDYCGSRQGPLDSGDLVPWNVVGNAASSRVFADSLFVHIEAGDEMDNLECPGDDPPAGGCPGGPRTLDPRVPFNDVVAHEFGHIMDFVYAGDRSIDDDPAARSVQEALADMFAYDYDRDDARAFEETEEGPARDWEDPGAEALDGQPYPAHLDDFDSTPPAGAPHFNSTILSHAYFLLVEDVGHGRAGNVLQFVPFALSPKPTFGEVARRFIERAHDLYGGAVSAPAQAAFAQVGIELPVPGPPEDPDCGPEAC